MSTENGNRRRLVKALQCVRLELLLGENRLRRIAERARQLDFRFTHAEPNEPNEYGVDDLEEDD